MIAKSLNELLQKGDRIAVSNITGREASKVSYISQLFGNNIVAGWALGKDGENVKISRGRSIKVFGQFEQLMQKLPEDKKPNKVIVYSPPEAVYGDVKEVVEYGKGIVETIFVITENVSVEVTAKLRRLCNIEEIDIIGCNTLGMINAYDGVRIGAVGGDTPKENFRPGSACIISNSGNMVNTIATYIQSAGVGVSFGISTGKDKLILTPLKELLPLAEADPKTKVIILYVEPGGVYEEEALAFTSQHKFKKPILVFVAGSFAEGRSISLGHAGAVVEGKNSRASAKMELFDNYFDLPVFDPTKNNKFINKLKEKQKGLRIKTLHDLAPAATTILDAFNIKRDFSPQGQLELKPWLIDLGDFSKKLPRDLIPPVKEIIEPYGTLLKRDIKSGVGKSPTRQSMRNTSHSSSNDGITPRIYGHSLLEAMQSGSFVDTTMLYWLGSPLSHYFESKLVEMCLTASLTNGPGTISAQGAKLSASAGNEPNTAMIGTLASIGTVHGGNGKRAAKMLIELFSGTNLVDPYNGDHDLDLDKMARQFVLAFKKEKAASKEAGVAYRKIPCLGHPVFNKDAVNYDPRERVIRSYLEDKNIYNIFLDFYHRLSAEMMDQQATSKVHAVNVDAAITCVMMAIAWPRLVNKHITIQRAIDLPFLVFALGRVAGGAGEFLDHRDSGTAMDMRIPVSECTFLGRIQE